MYNIHIHGRPKLADVKSKVQISGHHHAEATQTLLSVADATVVHTSAQKNTHVRMTIHLYHPMDDLYLLVSF